MSNNALDLAWAAGFIDGEGCIGVYGRNNCKGSYSLRLSVAQVDPRPLRQLQALWGGRIRNGAKNYGKRRVYWVWGLDSHKAAEAIAEMMPYFRYKLPQAELALEFAARVNKGKTGRHWLTDAERAIRAEMAGRLKALKVEVAA